MSILPFAADQSDQRLQRKELRQFLLCHLRLQCVCMFGTTPPCCMTSWSASSIAPWKTWMSVLLLPCLPRCECGPHKNMFTGRVAFHVNQENILDSIFVAALWTLKQRGILQRTLRKMSEMVARQKWFVKRLAFREHFANDL